MKKKPARPQVDWEAIERDWIEGVKSKAAISKEYGISRPAIEKHFAKLGISRNIGGAIRHKAKTLVAAAAVAGEVAGGRKVTEAATIEANATIVAAVQLTQRQDIQRTRRLAMSMLTELEGITENKDLVAEIIRSVSAGGEEDTAAAVRKLMGLPGRADTLRKLSDVLKALVALERQAFCLDDAGSGAHTHEDALEQLR